MQFEFATATRIVFGAGTFVQAAPAAREMGGRALLVTGRSLDRGHRLADSLASAGVSPVPFSIAGEPDVALVQEGIELARAEECTLVVALGGGSVIDAGKAIAALLTNDGALIDYLEVVGKGRRIARPAAPFIAIPTTAGTGAEVTRNAVLASPEHRMKASLRSPLILPSLAIVDPELTYSLPPALTAGTGMDALAQVIEPFVSLRANPMTDVFCLEGIRRTARSLHRAFADGRDASARADMSFASLMGGLALANAGLGAVHGCAAPIGGMFPAPHGAVCAILLGPVMEANIRALRERAPDSFYLARYRQVAAALTSSAGAEPEEGPKFVRELCERLAIPSLASYGIRKSDLPQLAGKATSASSMKGNPIGLTPQEIIATLTKAL